MQRIASRRLSIFAFLPSSKGGGIFSSEKHISRKSTFNTYKHIESVFKSCVLNVCIKLKQKRSHFRNSLIFIVGAKGFEPSTPCSQSRCASRTAPYPEVCFYLGGEGGIRTPGTPCGVRQFSKLLVSATHPPLQGASFCLNAGAKVHLFSIPPNFFFSYFSSYCHFN